jgi:hypothetical protein
MSGARGKTNWLITVIYADTGDEEAFGPYTQKQAEALVPRVERAVTAEYDDPEMFPIVHAAPVYRWRE